MSTDTVQLHRTRSRHEDQGKTEADEGNRTAQRTTPEGIQATEQATSNKRQKTSDKMTH